MRLAIVPTFPGCPSLRQTDNPGQWDEKCWVARSGPLPWAFRMPCVLLAGFSFIPVNTIPQRCGAKAETVLTSPYGPISRAGKLNRAYAFGKRNIESRKSMTDVVIIGAGLAGSVAPCRFKAAGLFA